MGVEQREIEIAKLVAKLNCDREGLGLEDGEFAFEAVQLSRDAGLEPEDQEPAESHGENEEEKAATDGGRQSIGTFGSIGGTICSSPG